MDIHNQTQSQRGCEQMMCFGASSWNDKSTSCATCRPNKACFDVKKHDTRFFKNCIQWNDHSANDQPSSCCRIPNEKRQSISFANGTSRLLSTDPLIDIINSAISVVSSIWSFLNTIGSSSTFHRQGHNRSRSFDILSSILSNGRVMITMSGTASELRDTSGISLIFSESATNFKVLMSGTISSSELEAIPNEWSQLQASFSAPCCVLDIVTVSREVIDPP